MDNSKNEIKETSSNEDGVIESISEWPPVVVGDGQESKIQKRINEEDVFLKSDEICSNSKVFKLDVERLTAKDVNHEDNLLNDTYTTELAEHHNVHVERTEMLANVALAKWWRREGRIICSEDDIKKMTSSNPNTLISILSRKQFAKNFMEKEVKRLESELDKWPQNAHIHAALGSFHEKLGNIDTASSHLNKAVSLLGKKNSWPHAYQWMAEKIKKQKKILDKQNQLNQLLSPLIERVMQKPRQIERRAADSLSWDEFMHRYAQKSVPVIITGLVHKMTTKPWTLNHIREKAGGCQVTLKRLVPHSAEWARLEEAETSTVGEFISSVESGPAEEPRYLFDWSIPIRCPQLAQEIIIPKYFAGDFLQRVNRGSLYQNSWPSLFIAPAGLRSELHVDAFGSNFWMALFQGKKRWMLYRKEDIASLYPRYEHSMDPVFEVDLKSPDLNKHPLLAQTEPSECILQGGELLFVPASCPHRVENLECSLAISSNYVDLSNFSQVKQELHINGLTDGSSRDLYEQFTAEAFPADMKSSITHLSWSLFKTWPPEDYHSYDIQNDYTVKQ